MKRAFGTVLMLMLGWSLSAQTVQPLADSSDPSGSGWDVRQFIKKNHVHEISGITTLSLAALTGAAGIALASGASWISPPVHGALAYGTIAAGAATLGLGLTAYSNRLDEVWPHALLMGVAETGMIVNAFVLKPGSTPHRITGAASITAMGLGLLSIILIKDHDENP